MSQINPVEIDVLRKLFYQAKPDFVFDVGANSGGYVKRLREEVGYEGLIASYEPIPELVASMRKQKDPKWHIFECVLSDSEGDKQFYRMKDSEFSSLRKPSHEHTNIFSSQNVIGSTLKVQGRTLSSEFFRLRNEFGFTRPFLKMDTQGCDLDVMRGGLLVANEFVALQSELSVTPIYDQSVDFRDALYFYQQIGFKIAAIFLPNLGHFPELIDLDVIMVNPKRWPPVGGERTPHFGDRIEDWLR